MALPRRGALLFAGASALAGSGARAEVGHGVTPRQFERWLALRGGLDGPAFWYSEGLVRSVKDGAVQSRMLGVETWVTAKTSANAATSLSRKIYFFPRTDSDTIVADDTGRPRRPSIFVYQLRTFTLTDGAIDYGVESHDLNGVRQGAKGSVYTVTSRGEQLHVNYAIFRGGVTAEIYDYFDNGPKLAALPDRYQMAWAGVTTTAGTVANQRGWRFPRFDSVPNEWLKRTVRDRFPLWMQPPKDMAEIETLRATVPYRVEGL